MKKRLIIPFLFAFISISFSSCKKEDSGDGTVPEIIVLGLNPIYWAVDIPYEDAGAVAFDISPTTGDTTIITNKIVVKSNVDVSTTGDYFVTYNVTDASGMSAEEKTRDVKVVIGK